MMSGSKFLNQGPTQLKALNAVVVRQAYHDPEVSTRNHNNIDKAMTATRSK